MKDLKIKKFSWCNFPEPHGIRRTKILKKHPEIRSLMGHDPSTKWICIFLVFLQLLLSVHIHKTNYILYFL